MSEAVQRWERGDKRPAIVQGIGATADMLAAPIAATGIGAPIAGLLKGVSMGTAGALAKYDAKVDTAHDLKIRREFLKNRTNQLPQEITGLIANPQPQNQVVTQPQTSQKQGSLWETLKKAEATHPLKSSNIRAVGYSKKDKALDVAFHSGSEYRYSDVPKSLFDRIKRVKSPGKFFNKHIKRKDYSYEKKAEYKMHWSKNLHRDITAGRHYPFSFLTGEAKELLDAAKNRDWNNFKEEIGDTTYAAQMLAAQTTGLNHPVYADLKKFYDREKVWKEMFKAKKSDYHPKHMQGGSNFAKPSKIIKAFESAGIKINQAEAERLANHYTGGKMEKEAGMPEHIRKAILTGDKTTLRAGQAAATKSRARNKVKAELKRFLDMGEEIAPKKIHLPSEYKTQTEFNFPG
jgi:NTP pyrophosphatase (non-canonical NTP hydrolase)